MQSLYAYFTAHDNNIGAAEKNMFRRIDRIYELYTYLASFLLEIVDFNRKRMEEGKNKFRPSDEDLNPNTSMTNNLLVQQLENNIELQKNIERYKISWEDHDELVRTISTNLRKDENYTSYLEKEDKEYKDHKEFLRYLFKNYIVTNTVLFSYFEEKSAFWVDDFDVASNIVIRTIKAFTPESNEFTDLPGLYKDCTDSVEESDFDFVKSLFRKTIIKEEEYEELIANKTKNWEVDRIALMDILLMKMALCEVFEFPYIPIKVTLNEYIEIAKTYSTPQSKKFINGILDKLFTELKENKLILKKGRGLLDK